MSEVQSEVAQAATTPTRELSDWQAQRGLLSRIREEDRGWRKCFGLALVPAAKNAKHWVQVPGVPEGRAFLSDELARWVTMVDIPRGYFRTARRPREVHWLTVRPTSFKFGMPCLLPGTEGHSSWDFRIEYRPDAEEGNADVLDPNAAPQLFKVANALERAMTSVAFHERSGSWATQRSDFYASLGLPGTGTEKVYLIGEQRWSTLPPPWAWMPRPWVAFPEAERRRLFGLATRAGHDDHAPPGGMCKTFMRAMDERLGYRAPGAGLVEAIDAGKYHGLPVREVLLAYEDGRREVVRFSRQAQVFVDRGQVFRAGTPIAEETFPVPRWPSADIWERWRGVVRPLFGSFLDAHLRIWFERELLTLPREEGLVWVSAEVAAPAAMGLAVPGKLYWDLSPAESFLDATLDAFIFPPVLQRAHQDRHGRREARPARWDDLDGVLPGEVRYNLRPADSRFRNVAEARAERARRAAD